MIIARIETILLKKDVDCKKNIVDLHRLKAKKIMRFAANVIIGLCVAILPLGCVHECDTDYGLEMEDSTTCRYRTSGTEGVLKLAVANDSVNEILHLVGSDTVDRWTLNYDVYRFDCGDLTGDGVPEVAAGTVKSTRYRPNKDKRLFIYHLYDGRYIRPLWLGSRVGRPLIDFRVEKDSIPNLVHTWEVGDDGDTVQALYKLKGFGLKFYRYLE